ncbi:ABC transporter substrate-binding protein [Nocardioides sambongensis]|uniref:ABC transporter substrate-binding protein n=1 Tax=Nocardioides sambongensis TaxID=2589074 RepID=UPI00112AE3F6|nr:ABC transporter substrate-binding protein [Nocardioides sambongensis]
MMRFTLPSSARKGALALTAVALTSTLSACGGDDAEAADPTVKISYFPLVHTATAVNAEESGLFEEEGVEVELLPSAGGAQAIPSLMAGDYDITYTNYSSAILAAQQGLPIVFVAGNDVGASDHGIFVAADSPIKDVADLEGGTFAVNNLQNIGTVAIKAQLEEAGADPESIELVEMPYPDMQAALDRGDVDAIWQVEPFQASAEAAGMRKIADLFTGPVADMPVAGWVTTQQFAQENPDAVAAVQDALAASADDLRDDREQIVELVPTYTEMDAAVVESVALPEWSSELDAEVLQEMTDLMEQYGVIAEEFDVETMMP